MHPNDDPVTIPPAIAEVFRHRVFISTPELAKLLGMNVETLFAEMEHGNLPWHQKGQGQKSPRRVFTLDDVMTLLQNMKQRSTKGQRAWREQQDSGAILPFSEKTSSGVATPTSGITNSKLPDSLTTAPATPWTNAKRKKSRPISKRQRKSVRAET